MKAQSPIGGDLDPRDLELLQLAKEYVRCAQLRDEGGASNALRAMLGLYDQPTTIPTVGIAAEPEIVQLRRGRGAGYRFDQAGVVIALEQFIGVRRADGSTITSLFLRTSSGNIYLVETGEDGALYFSNAKSRTSYQFPKSFPRGVTLTVGSPFVAELIRGEKTVTRYTSPVTEAVFVFQGGDIPEDVDSSAIIEDYEKLGGVSNETTDQRRGDLEIMGPVLLENRSILGARIVRATCASLFSSPQIFERSGPITHVFFKTESLNVYRLEKDYPRQGEFCLSDARSVREKSKHAERYLSWNDLATVVLEIGKPALFGTLSTSTLQEIVVFNCDRVLTASESGFYAETPETVLVDEFYGTK